jgi:hypothetical protein
MSRAKAILLASLLVATFGFAQDNPGNGTPGPSNTAAADQNSAANQSMNVRGCLSSSAMGDNSFTLTQDQTGKVFRLTGNTSDLASHAGHEVVLSGVLVSQQAPEASSAASNQPNAAADQNTLQVSGVQMVSDHCGATHPRENGREHRDNALQSADRMDLAAPSQATGKNAAEAARRQSDTNLPQTATILPLLGLVGLSSLVTGFIFRDR